MGCTRSFDIWVAVWRPLVFRKSQKATMRECGSKRLHPFSMTDRVASEELVLPTTQAALKATAGISPALVMKHPPGQVPGTGQVEAVPWPSCLYHLEGGSACPSHWYLASGLFLLTNCPGHRLIVSPTPPFKGNGLFYQKTAWAPVEKLQGSPECAKSVGGNGHDVPTKALPILDHK